MGLEKVDCFFVVRQLDIRKKAKLRQSVESVRATVFAFRAGRRIGFAVQLCRALNRKLQALGRPQPINEYLNQIGTDCITIQSAVSNQLEAVIDKLAQLEVLRF